MAEEGVGKMVVVQAGDVDRDPGRLGAGELMDGLGDEFLADAALPGDQDRFAARSHRLDVLEECLHLATGGMDGGEDLGVFQFAVKDLFFQAAVFLTEGTGGHRPLDAADETFLFLGLDVVVDGAELHAAYGGLQLIEAAEDDDRNLGILLADHLQQILPGKIGHGQVEEDHPDILFGKDLHDLAAFVTADQVVDAESATQGQSQ